MRNSEKNKGRLLLASLLCLLLCGCGEVQEQASPALETSYQQQLLTTKADRQTEHPEAARIDLDSQQGAVKITQAGSYLLTGSLSGTVTVDAEEQIVHLILDNVSLEAEEGSALQVLSAGKVILTAKEKTVNTLRDSAHYPVDTQSDACIYSECDLTINGGGTLNIHGYYKDAVHSKDVLKVLDVSLFAQSKRDGLRGNDGILLDCQSATVQSERNGLSTTKTGKPGKGNLEILSGEHSIIGGKYALNCASDLYIQEGKLYLMGVVADQNVEGQSYVQEGSLLHE